MARERIDACKEDIHLDLEGKTAAAFCIPELEIEYSARLTDGITIFTGSQQSLWPLSCPCYGLSKIAIILKVTKTSHFSATHCQR